MPRIKKGSAPPKVFDELSETAKRHVRKRQGENGYRDVKGLIEIISRDRAKQGLPQRSRSYMSLINKYLRKAEERRKQHAEWLKQIRATPEEMNATAIVGILLQIDQIYSLLDQFAESPPSNDTKEKDHRTASHKSIAMTWKLLAQALKDFKADARADGVVFKEAIEAVDKSIGLLAEKKGIPSDVVADIRAHILGIKRVVKQNEPKQLDT